MGVFRNYLDKLIGTGDAQNGATDWAAVTEDDIVLTATGIAELAGLNTNVLATEGLFLSAPGVGIGSATEGASVDFMVGVVPVQIFGVVDDAGTPKLSFFGVSKVARPTDVAVTAEDIHAALVSLGLITGP